MIYRIYRKLATQLVCAEFGSIDLNLLYLRVQVAAKLCPVDALIRTATRKCYTAGSEHHALPQTETFYFKAMPFSGLNC